MPTTLSTWRVTEGMYRTHCDQAAPGHRVYLKGSTWRLWYASWNPVTTAAGWVLTNDRGKPFDLYNNRAGTLYAAPSPRVGPFPPSGTYTSGTGATVTVSIPAHAWFPVQIPKGLSIYRPAAYPATLYLGRMRAGALTWAPDGLWIRMTRQKKSVYGTNIGKWHSYTATATGVMSPVSGAIPAGFVVAVTYSETVSRWSVAFTNASVGSAVSRIRGAAGILSAYDEDAANSDMGICVLP
jgi:hypothetical protein